MVNATSNSDMNPKDSKKSEDKSVEIKTLGDISHSDVEHVEKKQTQASAQPVQKTPLTATTSFRTKLSKYNVRTLLGVAVLALLLIGSGVGFYLIQYANLDIRQQAYLGQPCSIDTNCNGWPNEVCDNGQCVPANQNPTCPAFSAWGNCDPTPGTPENECSGSHYTANACTRGYIEWRCGNKQWIPDYGHPNNAQCAGDCPWDPDPVTGACCPTGGDACDPSVDNYKCIADPYVSRCEQWGNGSCPGGGGYWKAFTWCVNNEPGEDCACKPGGLFSGYSGPGCDCGGGGPDCNEQCSSTSECQGTNPNWICHNNRCRLSSNPSSASCSTGGGYQCNSDCSTTAQCQGDLGSAYSCVNNKCRLTSNPSSSTCQPSGGSYQCNSTCSTTAQCQGDLGSAYSCVNNRCRLTSNPSSSTCQPGSSELQCNDVCTSNNQCPAGTACLNSYDFSAGWTNDTGNVSGVGSGTITGFDSFTRNNIIEQYLVRGGRIWYRPNFSTAWSDVTSNVTSIGSGTITSFNVYVNASGAVEQWLVRGGKIWHRPNLSSNFQDVTSNVSGVGSGEITSYNVEKYSQNHGGIVSAYLIRGGKTWHHTSSNWDLWQDVTGNLSGVGSGTLTDNGFVVRPSDQAIIHHVVRNGQIWSRTSPLTNQNRCRLPAYPNSGSCQPPSGSLTCNSDCTSNAQCAAVNSEWSCVSNKCRLTSNPTSPTCEPEDIEAPMCKDVAILDQNNNELIPTATPNPFFVGQIIKFRCAADDPASTLIARYEFRISEPDGTIVEGADINPGGKSAISLDYQIKQNGTFSAQCRICQTDGTCQPYVAIGTR